MTDDIKDTRSFKAGYLLACANLVHLHGDEVCAVDLLDDAGFNRADMHALPLDDYDREPLSGLFDMLEARRRTRLEEDGPHTTA